MVDVSQWRAVIGQWNNRCSTSRVSTNTVKGSGNVSDSTGGGAGPTVSVIILVLAGLLVMLSGDVELNPGPWPDVTCGAVVDLLSGVSNKWNEIGLVLDVPKNYRKELIKNSDSSLIKLEDVIDKWIESRCSEVSWDHLITVLRSEQLKMAAVAKKVEDYLSKHEAESSHTRVSLPVQHEASSSTTQVTHQMEQYRYGHSLRELVSEKPNMQCSESFLLLTTFPNAHISELSGQFSQSNTHQQMPKQYSSNRSFEPQTISAIPPIIQPVSDPNIDHSPHGIQVQPQLKNEFHNPRCHVDHDADSIGRYKQDLIAMYKRKKPSYLKSPSPFLKYINLSLVQSKRVGRETIEISDILCESTGIKFPILIKGDPGVGKTTLAWEFCVRWANAEEESLLRNKWKIVKLIQLRAKEVREAEKVDKLLDPYLEYDKFRDYIMNAENAGKEMLLIFDGFDELSHEQQKESSLIMRLLEGVTLSQASIIVTSRPSDIQHLPERFSNLDQYIEVKGFRDEHIQEYIKCKFENNDNVLDAFKDYISSHEFIFTLMYVPLHCALVTELYEELYHREKTKFEPKTFTQLYTYFIYCLIQRNTGIKVDNIDELPFSFKDKFKELARIAAEGITYRQYVFDIGIDDEFGMLQKVHTSSICGTVQSVSCSFLHLTLQEYLAAYHWSNALPFEVAVLFKENGALPIEEYFTTEGKMGSSSSKENNNYIHWPALHFYSGLTGVMGTPLEEEITKHKLVTNEGQNSTKFNFFRLLFESQNPTLVSLVFPQDSIVTYRIESANEAYVTGYCIARAMESVKWRIEMDSSTFMKNLVDGIKHANSKGSFIRGLTVCELSDGDIFKCFDYIEQISEFVKDLCFAYFYKDESVIMSNKARTDMRPNWSFSLVEFFIHISSQCYYTIEELNDFVLSLFSALACIKMLRMAAFHNIPFIRSTIDGEGFVCISFMDHKQCFRNFSISSLPCLPQNYSRLIPYAVVRNTERYHGFGFLKHGYHPLIIPMDNVFIKFPALHYIVKSVYSLCKLTLNCHEDIETGFDVILFDINHEFLLTEYYSIYFYNTETKNLTELKIAELWYGGSAAANCIMMVVNEGNEELLTKNILKGVADKIHTLKLVCDSSELTKVAQSLKGTNIEIKTICNIAMETVAEYEFHACCLKYDYFESSASCVAKTQYFRDARLSRCCFDTLLFTLKETKDYFYPFSKFNVVSLSLSFNGYIRGRLTNHDIDIFEAFTKKLLINSTYTASLKELTVDFVLPQLRDDILIRLGKVSCNILEKSPLEVVKIYCSKKSATMHSTSSDDHVKLLYKALLDLTTLKVLIIEKYNKAFDELLRVILHLAAGNTQSVVVFDDCSFSSDQYWELLDKAISSTGNIKEIYIREGELSTVEAIKELPLNIDANFRIILSHWPYDGTSYMNDVSSQQFVTIIDPRHFEECVESLKIYRTKDINDSYWDSKQNSRKCRVKHQELFQNNGCEMENTRNKQKKQFFFNSLELNQL